MTGMNDDVVIICENLYHSYDGRYMALEDVNVTISRGEVVGVIGQNGSGKTTLVKHFNGLLKPTDGRVLVNGVDTMTKTVNELSRYTGYVFQNPNHQLFAKTVAEELAFGPTNLGLSPEEVQERVRQAAEFFKLEPFLEHHPYRLSFPLRKQVGMASIFSMRPAVMVLDEPTTGQDHVGTRIVHDLVGRLHDEGTTVVIVSHDMELIAEQCDRVIVLWQARVIGNGKPAEIFTNDELLEKTRLNAPQITRLSRRLDSRAHCGIALTVEELHHALAGKLRGS